MKARLISWTFPIVALLAMSCAPEAAQKQQPAAPTKSTMLTKQAGSPASTAVAEGNESDVPPVDPNPVEVRAYVMSKCPYAATAIPELLEAVGQMGPSVRLRLAYIGTANNGSLQSMHGQAEVQADMMQVCAAKVAPSRYLDFVRCQFENFYVAENVMSQCAQRAQIEPKELAQCVADGTGKRLLAQSFAQSANDGVVGSPTIVINQQKYAGRRRAATFLRSVCSAHGKEGLPDVCRALPTFTPINVYILTDKRCADCDVSRYDGFLRTRFDEPNIQVLDVHDERGSELYKELADSPIPIIVFDKQVDNDPAYPELQRHMKTAGDYRVMVVGNSWFPKCSEKGGCRLDSCKQTFQCRKETPRTLELFVMSQCPFGVRASDSMRKVLDRFGSQIHFKVHYIGSGNAADGFHSMHGDGEVQEDLRQVCAQSMYGWRNRFMDYVWCRNKDIRSDKWESCATKGISKHRVKACAEGAKGKHLLDKDFGVSTALGIGASPTWVANGKYKFSGLDAETVRKNLCNHNPKLRGCDKPFPADANRTPAPPTAGCGN